MNYWVRFHCPHCPHWFDHFPFDFNDANYFHDLIDLFMMTFCASSRIQLRHLNPFYLVIEIIAISLNYFATYIYLYTFYKYFVTKLRIANLILAFCGQLPIESYLLFTIVSAFIQRNIISGESVSDFVGKAYEIFFLEQITLIHEWIRWQNNK